MRKWLVFLAVGSAYVLGRAQSTAAPRLENARVRVTELDYEPGKSRPKSIRQSDQAIVFLDACRYERIDPDTGAKEIRVRKSGDVIWHNKGEVAPVLMNLDSRTCRTLVIELK